VPKTFGVLAFVLVVASAGCGPGAAVVPTSTPPNVPESDVSWYLAAAPGGHSLLVGALRSPRPGRHVGVLLVTGSEGLNSDYVKFGRELAARGFDVAFGCWFQTAAPVRMTDAQIGCADAPGFKGVADAAVPDLDALVVGARTVLGEPRGLALVGFSRGGGIAMLRASAGAREPVVSVAGMVEGTTMWGQLPDEVDVVARAGGFSAPVLLLHGTGDGLVPVAEARDMERALREHGSDVEAKYYDDAPHGLAQVPAIRADLLGTITRFLCTRLDCTPTTTRTPGPR
jgi:dienelactone hydrolase